MPAVSGGSSIANSGQIADEIITSADIKNGEIVNADISATAAIAHSKLANVSATARALGRKTAGAGAIEELTLSELLDLVGSAAHGDILYRGASNWARLGTGTAGQVLVAGGAGAAPAWQSTAVWNQVKKTTDESRASTTTFADDTDLKFAVAANKIYTIRGFIIRENEGTTGEFKFQFNGPTIGAGHFAGYADWISTNFATVGTKSFITYATSANNVDDNNGQWGWIRFNAYLVNGANAGTFAFQWAQQVSNATPSIVTRGSYIEWLETT